jgi:hypothetical protein
MVPSVPRKGCLPVKKPLNRSLSRNTKSLADGQEVHTISAHFDVDTYRAFKMLGAQQCKTTNALLNEALALLFSKHRQDVPPKVREKLGKLGIR